MPGNTLDKIETIALFVVLAWGAASLLTVLYVEGCRAW